MNPAQGVSVWAVGSPPRRAHPRAIVHARSTGVCARSPARGHDTLRSVTELSTLIRTVPDWPKPGILFYDITTLLADADGFTALIDAMSQRWLDVGVDAVIGVEARGFIIGPALAYNLHVGFIPVRKPAKLPWRTAEVTYDLEYGTDTLQIHADALSPGMRVLVCDDLLATGGTAAAAVQLCRGQGADVVGASFAVELNFLDGRSRLPGVEVHSVISYDE